MIHARLRPGGRLTDVSHRPRTHDDDVPLAAFPPGNGPWTYDAQARLAVPAPLTPLERLARVQLPPAFAQALALRVSAEWERASAPQREAVQSVLDRGGAAALAALRE